MTPVFVAIVNYRTGRLVVDCLASLESQVGDLRGGRVIVADNDSGDDSLELLRGAVAARHWSGWVEVLPLPRNGGFAYGNNAAIARIREIATAFHSVILLNPDTLARDGVVARLTGHLDAHPQAGIAGAAIENEAGEREISAHAMPSPLGELEGAAQLGVLSRLLSRHVVSPRPRDASHPCDWVSGACMAIRREALDAVGPMDEEFFLYYEEVDFCRRAARAGWTCWFVADARVVHFEGAATGIKAARRRLPPYWFDSRRRFFLKSLRRARPARRRRAPVPGPGQPAAASSARPRRPAQCRTRAGARDARSDRERRSVALARRVGRGRARAARGGVMSARLGVVVIGRNEGTRLAGSLDSVCRAGHPVVYVDSGSSDGSAALAAARSAQVVELDPARPFSAARARNEGFAALTRDHPVDRVQFLDGDCTLLTGWLEAAEAAIDADPRRAIVIGPLQERHPEASVYNRMCALEWKSPAGDLADFGSLGGIMFIRADVFASLHGFDERVIAGEDSELGVRVAAAGFKVTKIAQPMATHDADIHRFGQWWRRAVRAGHAIGQRFSLHGRSAARDCARERRSVLVWGAALPATMLLLAPVSHGLSFLLAGGYLVLGQRIVRYRLGQGDEPRDARLYARFVVIAKFAEALGLLRFHLNQMAGKFRIIEYK